ADLEGALIVDSDDRAEFWHRHSFAAARQINTRQRAQRNAGQKTVGAQRFPFIFIYIRNIHTILPLEYSTAATRPTIAVWSAPRRVLLQLADHLSRENQSADFSPFESEYRLSLEFCALWRCPRTESQALQAWRRRSFAG